jgi:MYXO-CTERM domain-containing protein
VSGRRIAIAALVVIGGCSDAPRTGRSRASLWTPLAVAQDPLVRMPGSQPNQGIKVDAPNGCDCHAAYNTAVEPMHNWKGSMMAQAARDPIFFAALTVAAQDSIHAVGRPNATDICLRCHFPKGWIEGRNDPTNASLMTGADHDGVQCGSCHIQYDAHFEATHLGTREGSDWAGYWDETGQSSTPSAAAAATARQENSQQAAGVKRFNGTSFFSANLPPASWSEAAGGQTFLSGSGLRRAGFADAGAKHQFLYSRYHKSKYFCASCHDVSNPVLANLAFKNTPPGDGVTVLPSEKDPAYSYFHAERTFSEFMLSAYGQQGGAAGIGPFAPTVFKTSSPGNAIARCQDCHMRDATGVACKQQGVDRPAGSVEHPKSGQPLHDLTGGNLLVSSILASAAPGSPSYDAANAGLLGQTATLTLSLTQGEGLNAAALAAGADRAKQQLQLAASIDALSYASATGALGFRVQNRTGHKLISGFPEGRRMFVNVKVLGAGGQLLQELNPYDAAVGTLKGLPTSYSPSSPALGANELHRDELVYETHLSSTVTGESKTFHFALATGRSKDNRIPPKGFQITAAAARLAEPVWAGAAAPNLFTAAEYSGGYDEVSLTVPTGAAQIVVSLYYQVTSREYVEFLRDEIKGPPAKITLPASAYLVQSDPFFAKLKGWGDTIWQLWLHNKDRPGAAPYLMAQAQVSGPPCVAPVPSLTAATPGDGQVSLVWSDKHSADPLVTGYRVYLDQAGKAQLVTQTGKVTTAVATGLTNGQSYCFKVASLYASCESTPGNLLCATPTKKPAGASCTGDAQCTSGYCVDGVCCASACGGGDQTDCQACSVAAGGTSDGSCAPRKPGSLCRAAVGECDAAEVCSGTATACPANAFKPDGTACLGGSGTCLAGSCVSKSDGGVKPPDLGLKLDVGTKADVGTKSDLGGKLDTGTKGDLSGKTDSAKPDAGAKADAGAKPDGGAEADAILADQGPAARARGRDRPGDPRGDLAQRPDAAPSGGGGDGCSCAVRAGASEAPWPVVLLVALAFALRRRRPRQGDPGQRDGSSEPGS